MLSLECLEDEWTLGVARAAEKVAGVISPASNRELPPLLGELLLCRTLGVSKSDCAGPEPPGLEKLRLKQLSPGTNDPYEDISVAIEELKLENSVKISSFYCNSKE